MQLSVALLLLLGLLHMCVAVPVMRVKRQGDLLTLELDEKDSELNPINAEDVASDDLERNKRKLPDATFEAKNAVLGFVFGAHLQRFQRAVAKSVSQNDDTPEFDRKNVSVDFPDELFNKSFSTLTNVSKAVSNLIMNSARRYSRFMLFLKPVFGDALVVRGYETPTTTTTTTTTTRKPM